MSSLNEGYYTAHEDEMRIMTLTRNPAELIFATYNANFPVLGDAEQVDACQYQH